MAFTRRYDEEQRELVCRLIREEGKSAPETVALVAEGVYGIVPFEIPESTARAFARQARAKEERVPLAERPPDEALDHLSRRALTLVDHVLAQHEQEEEDDKLDVERFRACLRSIKELADIHKLRGRGASPPGGINGTNGEGSSFFEKLVRDQRSVVGSN